MFKILFLLFLVIPIVEIAVLIQLSEVIGGWTTIVLVVITAYLGAQMVKQQGLQTIAQIQQKTAAGQIPGEELFSGVCILISGVLLVTPGIMTDIVGFLLLTPMVRQRMAAILKQKIHAFATSNGGFKADQVFTFGTTENHDDEYQEDFSETTKSPDKIKKSPTHENQVIEGDFKRKE